MNLYKIYIVLSIIFILFISSLLIINPAQADYLFREDGVMEFLSITIAGLSMALALILSHREYKKRGVWKFWLGLGFLSFLFIGESISWGERIFNIKMPIIAGIKFDAIHDLLAVSIGIIKKIRGYILETGLLGLRSLAIIIILLAGLFFIVRFLTNLILKHRNNIKIFFKANLKKAPFTFLFIALVLIAIAIFIDEDNFVNFPHKEVVDEGLEILAVLAFVFSSICGFIGGKWGFANRKKL